MTRILVMSDSHGSTSLIRKVLLKEKGNFDRLFHLGDRSSDMVPFRNEIPDYIQIMGNMELLNPGNVNEFPSEGLMEIENIIIFAVHGHLYHVHSTTLYLKKAAMERKAGLVLFGHTHIQESFQDGNIFYFNPGALKDGYYGLLSIDNGKIIHIENLSL